MSFSSAWTQLSAFGTCDRGTVALVFGLSLVPIVLGAGISLDYARALNARQLIQNATDAAAMAGAKLPLNDNDRRGSAAKAAFDANMARSHLAGIEPEIVASGNEVMVAASYSMPTTFTSIAGIDAIDLKVTTRARTTPGDALVCLLALNPTANDALHLQGSTRQVAEGCAVWVNSSAPRSVNAVGASSGQADSYCTAGGISGAEHFSPSPQAGCQELQDPFAAEVAKYIPPSGCKENNLRLKKGKHVLEPGVYCGGITLQAHAEVEFRPGVYVIKDGVLRIQAQASAAGTGVAFYFTGDDAQLEVLGGADVDFKAPMKGAELAGFVFVQDRLSNPGTSTTIQGGGTVNLEGIVYMPTWRVEIAGNGDLNQTSGYFAMVADSFYLRGNGNLNLRADAESPGLPQQLPRVPGGARLVQ